MRPVASKRRSWRMPGPCLLIESGAGGRCGRSCPNLRQQRRAALLEWLAFFLKFSKGCFIERTASRLSDVLGKDTAPDWLTSLVTCFMPYTN